VNDGVRVEALASHVHRREIHNRGHLFDPAIDLLWLHMLLTLEEVNHLPHVVALGPNDFRHYVHRLLLNRNTAVEGTCDLGIVHGLAQSPLRALSDGDHVLLVKSPHFYKSLRPLISAE